MDKSFYRNILLMVNSKDTFEMLQSYAEVRIAALREHLETATDIDMVRKLQGSIQELKRIRTLREETIKGAE